MTDIYQDHGDSARGLAPGDLCVVDRNAERAIVAVLAIESDHALVCLVTNEIEMATDTDMVLPVELTGARFPLCLQAAIFGAVALPRLRERVGHVSSEVRDALGILTRDEYEELVSADGRSSTRLRRCPPSLRRYQGLPLVGTATPRWAFKQDEAVRMLRFIDPEPVEDTGVSAAQIATINDALQRSGLVDLRSSFEAESQQLRVTGSVTPTNEPDRCDLTVRVLDSGSINTGLAGTPIQAVGSGGRIVSSGELDDAASITFRRLPRADEYSLQLTAPVEVETPDRELIAAAGEEHRELIALDASSGFEAAVSLQDERGREITVLGPPDEPRVDLWAQLSVLQDDNPDGTLVSPVWWQQETERCTTKFWLPWRIVLGPRPLRMTTIDSITTLAPRVFVLSIRATRAEDARTSWHSTLARSELPQAVLEVIRDTLWTV